MTESGDTPRAGLIDTAIVLAAGFGKRMRPLTDDKPKPLVELAGRTLIDHVLGRLSAAGIKRAVVNAHYHADKLIAYVNGREQPSITISDESDAILDTGGGVVRALPLLGPNPFLIHNSDSVWIESVGSNIDRLLAAWEPSAMDSVLLLAPSTGSLGYDGAGDFVMDADGRLARRADTQIAPFVFAGVSIAHPRLFDGAPQGAFSLNVLWDRAIASGRLYGVPLEGKWMHVGTPEALAEAEALIAAAPTDG